MTPNSANLPAQSYTSSNLQKHTSTNPLQQWLLRRFHRVAADLVLTTGAHTILDAGCGEGLAMHYVLRGMTMPTVGVDESYGALQIAQQLHHHRSFAASDVLNLPFPDRSFELVICMEVLEHLPEPERGLAELRRVSSRWLVLSVPNEPLFRGANFLRGKNVRAWGNDPGHLNHWSARSFTRFAATQSRVDVVLRSFPWTLVRCRVD